ncbi:unnamed protein product [Calicophoron daubneyi]|uniref:Protein FAM60A n=1 Tax=Calicophoron daubneyi TaxID=300641 RepID=A0AAV2THK2_CALDB
MGGGSGSGRAHFRSQSGCCICGTKSSSSRFTISQRYSEHFGDCFGPMAASRSGDLCNACVLCVKRWLQRGKRPGLFAQVLDSKSGPGPKHMKEITKRARRRQAKQANANKESGSKGEQLFTNSNTHRGTNNPNSGQSSCTRSTGGNQTSNLINSVHRGLQNASLCRNGHSNLAANNHPLLSELASSSGYTSNRSNVQSFLSEAMRLGATVPDQSLLGFPFTEGATLTRAAAARQLEAATALAAAAALASNGRCEVLSSSTPSRGHNAKDGTSPSTPSETSDYGSCGFGFSSGCSSRSSSYRCPTLSDTTGSCCSGSSCGGATFPPSYCGICSQRERGKKSRCCDSSKEKNFICPVCLCPVPERFLTHPLNRDGIVPTENNESTNSVDSAISCPSRTQSQRCAFEFRHPPPPPTSGNGAGTKSADEKAGSQNSAQSEPPVKNGDSQPSVGAPTTRRYNRRVVLPPVHMTHNAEVNSLLREIMERNSEAVNFDSREMHMAVQQELRLRNRTVNAARSTSDSISGRASTISSADGSLDVSCSNSLTAPNTCNSGGKDQCEHLPKRQRLQQCHCCHHCAEHSK